MNIRFQKYISPVKFEIILSNYYVQSKKSDKVTFNLELVERSSIFELGQITIWIKELLKKSIDVFVVLPINDIFFKFLDQYRFLDLLNSLNVKTNHSLTSKSDSSFLTTPFLPIKFYSKNEYGKLLAYLDSLENYKKISVGLETSKVMHPSVFRGIVLKELGDNIYRHANGTLPVILMTKSLKKETDISFFDEDEDDRKSFASNYFNCELEYLNYMGWSNIITIVVSDKGMGLSNIKLKKAYKKDEIIPNKKNNPTEYDLIKYAFLEHSTTSDPKERMGELEALLTHFNKKRGSNDLLPPVTGLFRLYNIVKKYKGFIFIRTGKSILTMDFKESSDQPKIRTYSKIGKDSLVKFGGTQYKMYFPIIDKQIDHEKYKSKKFSFNEASLKIPFHYVSLDKMFPNEGTCLTHQIKNFGETFIQQHKLKNESHKSGLIVDFNNLMGMDKKAIYFILAYLMRSQTIFYIHTIINISQEDLIDLKSFFNKEVEGIFPIVCFDRAFKRYLIGIDTLQEKIYNNLLAKETNTSEDENEFVNKYKHLFIEENKSVKFIHNRNNIFSIARSNIAKDLSDYILNENNNIYRPNYKVLLPSKLYSNGFFEIYNLFDNNIIKGKVQQFIIYSILEYQPQLVITITKNISNLLEAFIREIKLLDKRIKFKHIRIDNPIDMSMSSFFDLGLSINKTDSVFIITDVVGSSTTIKNILSAISESDKIYLLTFVNASEIKEDHFDLNNLSIHFSWLVKKQLSFYKTLPRNWLVEEVVYLDSNKLRLIKKEKKTGPLFTENIDLFRYCFEGHFLSGAKHYTHLFDIPTLLKKYKLQFIDLISKSIQEIDEAFTVNRPHVIIYPSFNPGLKILAEELAIKILCPTISLSREELNYYQSNSKQFNDYTAVILDDAFESGSTIMKLIEYANKMNVNNIFIYIIINRGTELPKLFFENINLYNSKNIIIKYLVSINIPSFILPYCPHCKRIEKLKEIKNIFNKYNMTALEEHINTTIAKLEVISLDSLDDVRLRYLHATSNLKSHSLSLRHQIEESKNNILTRTKLLRSIFEQPSDHIITMEFFRQLYIDDLYDILFMKYDTDIFEKEVEASITKYCEKVLGEMDKISEDEFISIIEVISRINPLFLKDKMLMIMRENLSNPQRLFIILINIISHPNLLKYSKEIRKDIEQLFKFSENYHELLNEYIRFLNDYANTEKVPSNTFFYYEELVTFYHKLNDMKQRNVAEGQDLEELLTLWKNAEHTIVNIVRNLRGLLTIDIEDLSTHKKIKRLINKIVSLIEMITSAQYLDNSKKSKMVVDAINQIYHILIDHDEISLKHIRQDLAPDLLEVINYQKQLHLQRLNEKNINFKIIEQPTTNFNVFCDKESLMIILKNIFDNVINHSEAKNLFVVIKKEKDKDTIDTYFIDDGKGLSDDFEENTKSKKGYNLIKECASKYTGLCLMEKYSNKIGIKLENGSTFTLLRLKHIK